MPDPTPPARESVDIDSLIEELADIYQRGENHRVWPHVPAILAALRQLGELRAERDRIINDVLPLIPSHLHGAVVATIRKSAAESGGRE